MARYFPGGKITAIHGKPRFEHGRAYIPLFHPAAVLRNMALEPQMEADFRLIPELAAKMRALRASGHAPSAPPSPVAPADEPPPTQLKLF
jgi:uracil-DNA glycosylase